MYAIAGYVYDESDIKIVGAKITAYFIKRKSASSPSTLKSSPVFSNLSGYYSFNLADKDFLDVSGKYDTTDEILIACEVGDKTYARVVHVMDVSNEYNVVNIKPVLNKVPIMNFSLAGSGVVGMPYTISGSASKNENSFVVLVNGINTTESQKRTYDAFTIFDKNKIVSTAIDWGDGATGASTTHSYTSSGSYTITVTSTDGYGDTGVQTFAVQAKYLVSTNNVCDTPTIYEKPVKFTAVNTGHIQRILKTEWYCDGIKIGEGDNIIYSFLAPGSHAIKDVVTYNDGFADVTCEKTNYYIVNTYSVLVNNICDTPDIYNRSVKFTSLPTGDISKITKTEWFIDNIKVGEGDFVNHTFTSPGNKQVKNTVTYFDGFQTRTASKTNIYKVNELTIGADLTWNPVNPIKEVVTFTPSFSTTTPTVASLMIEPVVIRSVTVSSDGKVINPSTQKITYSGMGVFLVRLDYEYYNGFTYIPAYVEKEITVTKRFPIDYDFNWTPSNPKSTEFFEVDFYNRDIYVGSYDFNPGVNFSGEQRSDYEFKIDRTSDVDLIIMFDNSWNFEEITKIKTVEMQNTPPIAGLDLVSTTIKSQKVIFKSDSSDIDGIIVKYLWEVLEKNGPIVYNVTNSDESDVEWICIKEGIYIVSLTVTDDDGAESTKMQEFEVKFDNIGTGSIIYLDGAITIEVGHEDFEIDVEEDEEITIELTDEMLDAIL